VIETKKRSLVKALGWRLTAGLVTFCTSYYFTHSLASAGAIVGSDFLSKAGTMYIGERLFSKVRELPSLMSLCPRGGVIRRITIVLHGGALFVGSKIDISHSISFFPFFLAGQHREKLVRRGESNAVDRQSAHLARLCLLPNHDRVHHLLKRGANVK